MHPAFADIRRARPLLGTFVEITIAASGCGAEPVIDAAFAAIADVHRLMSFHDPDSDVARLNREAAARPVAVHRWTWQVLQAALELHHRSGGMFDIAVAPVLQDLGLLPGRPHRTMPHQRTMATTAAIELLPGGRVRFHHPDLALDLGGIAKGFAVDRAIDVLRTRGIAGLVNAGGDLAAVGAASHVVHLRDPRRPDRLMSPVALRNEALASSGGGFDPLRSRDVAAPTVIDPAARAPARAIAGASVRAASCMIADALTKVVMLAGEQAGRLLDEHRASAMLISAHGEVLATADWQDACCLAT